MRGRERETLAFLAATALTLVMTGTRPDAQALYRPMASPAVSAAAEAWYQLGEPVLFAGDLYYRAGAVVFFDGHVMVPTGQYRGIPIYANAARAPFSVVYVPIGRGQLQPYERRRSGALAGTVASQPPSFPVALRPDDVVGAPAPAFPSPGVGALLGATVPPARAAGAVGRVVADIPAEPVPPPSGVATVQRPASNDGVWITIDGVRWVSSGPAVARTADMQAQAIGGGRTVYRSRLAGADTLYLPTRGELVAPFRRKS